MAEYKKGDWVRVLHTDYREEFPVGSLFKVGEVLDHGVEPSEDFDPLFFCNWEIQPWQPKVGERVRVVRHVNSYGSPIHMDLPIGSIHTVSRIGDALGNKDRPSFTLSGGGFNFYLVENLEPATDTPPVAEQPAALTIQAGKFYKTRDGRKVGPLRDSTYRSDWPFIGAAEGEPEAYYKADGSCPYIPDDDLVAEWVDAPVRDITAATVDAINDEYGPVLAVVHAPKFKVGNRVFAKTVPEAGVGIVEADLGGGTYRVDFKDTWYRVCTETDNTIEHAPAPTTAIVALIEDGQPLPATRPARHTSAEAADAEARRLAGVHKGQEFGVFVLTGATHKEAKVFEHEWQRLAAEGEKIRAIKALRAAAGTDLKSAKDAVEFFTTYRAA